MPDDKYSGEKKNRKQVEGYYSNCRTVTPNVPTVRIEVRTKNALIQEAFRRGHMQKQEERPCRKTRESCTSGRSSSNGHSSVGCLARQSSDETISQIDHSRAMHIQPRRCPQWTLCTLFGRRCMATLRPGGSPRCQPVRCRNWRDPSWGSRLAAVKQLSESWRGRMRLR